MEMEERDLQQDRHRQLRQSYAGKDMWQSLKKLRELLLISARVVQQLVMLHTDIVEYLQRMFQIFHLEMPDF